MDDMKIGEVEFPWTRLAVVGLKTTADGPFAEDVFWLFVLDDGTLHEVPGAGFSTEALDGLQRQLPGFDSEKVVRAMGSTEDRVFRLWARGRGRLPPEVLGERFGRAVAALGGRAAPGPLEALLAAWGGESRHYHDLEHLSECLRELDEADVGDEDRARAELALFYHDAVYEPRARDNEERSADLALADARTLGIPATHAEAIARLVRATAHLARPASEPLAPDEALVVDVDLCILGQEPIRFMEFEHAVELEYRDHVPRAVYFTLRKRFLRSLLDAERVFRTEAFRAKYEGRARENLALLLGSRRYGWLHRLFG